VIFCRRWIRRIHQRVGAFELFPGIIIGKSKKPDERITDEDRSRLFLQGNCNLQHGMSAASGSLKKCQYPKIG